MLYCGSPPAEKSAARRTRVRGASFDTKGQRDDKSTGRPARREDGLWGVGNPASGDFRVLPKDAPSSR